jgi:hypothetical protein
MSRVWRIGAVLLACVALTCSSSPASCPTVACQPTITLNFRQAVPGDYAALIVLQNVTYQVTCPSNGPPTDSPPRLTCDGNGITLTGIDLGHGDVEQLDMTVELITGDAAIVYPVTVTMMSIANSIDCELVCYQHTGTVGN